MNPIHSPPMKEPPSGVLPPLKKSGRNVTVNQNNSGHFSISELYHKIYFKKIGGASMAKTYLVQTLLRNCRIPLEIIFLIRQFILLRIDETKEFGEDGKPTGRIIGYSLTCVELTNYERFTAKVSTLKIPITNDELQAIRNDGGKVLIELDNATIMPYINERNNALTDSIKADGFRVVPDKEVNLL